MIVMRSNKTAQRWKLTIGGVMFFTAGFGLSLTFFRDHPAGVVVGGVFLAGTIGNLIGRVYYGTDEACESGFVLGCLVGIIVFPVIALVMRPYL